MSPTNTVSVLLNLVWELRAERDYGAGDEPSDVAIGDVNRDGRPDLATANAAGNSVSVLLNRGDGSFQESVVYATGLNPTSVGIGDLDGDGAADLAVANLGNLDGSTVSVFINNGDGTFSARQFPDGGWPSQVESAT